MVLLKDFRSIYDMDLLHYVSRLIYAVQTPCILPGATISNRSFATQINVCKALIIFKKTQSVLDGHPH